MARVHTRGRGNVLCTLGDVFGQYSKLGLPTTHTGTCVDAGLLQKFGAQDRIVLSCGQLGLLSEAVLQPTCTQHLSLSLSLSLVILYNAQTFNLVCVK